VWHITAVSPPFAWGVLLVAFVVGELGTTMRLPSWVIDASPFAHLSQLPGGEFERASGGGAYLAGGGADRRPGWAAYRPPRRRLTAFRTARKAVMRHKDAG
jgi:hypothetical protein